MLSTNRTTPLVLSICIAVLFASCGRQPTCHDEMIGILKSLRTKTDVARNPFFPAAGIIYMDSLLKVPYSTPSRYAIANISKPICCWSWGKKTEPQRCSNRLPVKTKTSVSTSSGRTWPWPTSGRANVPIVCSRPRQRVVYNAHTRQRPARSPRRLRKELLSFTKTCCVATRTTSSRDG